MPATAPGADLERLRPRLFGVAYRMLGRVQDAEDLVQESFLRWHQAPRDDVERPEAWLVSVVTRLAIDNLRRRATERAAYRGPWLPEPVSSRRLAAPPDRGVERSSDLSMAFLVLLERLAPEERAAFLLRDVFESSYAEIARTLEKSEAAARQIVHRARGRVRSDRRRFDVPVEVTGGLLRRFLSALETDDEETLLAVLAPDAIFTSDGGGRVPAARRIIHGADRVVRLLRTVEAKFARPFTYRIVSLNGEPALVQHLGPNLFAATFIETDGERIAAFYRVMNPDKLGDVR
jgi:RNA polymerase sigma-70 factor (ECF subfamily)